MVDQRVPAKERLLVAGAIVYAFVPFDFIPDMLPFVGQVDDAYLIALTLLRLMSVTESARRARALARWRRRGGVNWRYCIDRGAAASEKNQTRTDVES